MPDASDNAVVCNTGPLLALSRIREIGLLTKLFSKVIIPREVVNELLMPSYADTDFIK